MNQIIERMEYDSIAEESALIAPNSDWSGIEKGFEWYIQNQDEKKLLSYIITTLERNTKKKYNASVVNKNMKEAFFGCRVFPDQMELEQVAAKVLDDSVSYSDIYNTWANIQNWVIEIDAQVFNRYELNLNPSELTAIILHEIGHVIYYDSAVERFYRAFRECQIRYKIADKASTKILYRLYMIPLSISCAQKTWVERGNGRKLEVNADALVVEQGYGEYLASALNKIVKAYGTTITKTYDNSMNDKELSEYINWATLNVADVTYRREKLKDELYNRAHRYQSNYITILSKNLMKFLGINMRETYTGAVVEANLRLLTMDKEEFLPAYEMYWNVTEMARVDSMIRGCSTSPAMEGFGFDKKPPSRYDLDCIQIEIDRMTDQRDRIFILDLIYNQMRLIEEYEAYMAKHKDVEIKNGDRIKQQKEQLNMMREMVLAKKTFQQKDYKVFVKYPTGYEGQCVIMNEKGFTPRQLLEEMLNIPDELLDKPIKIYNPDEDTIYEGNVVINDVTIDDFGSAMAIFCKTKKQKSEVINMNYAVLASGGPVSTYRDLLQYLTSRADECESLDVPLIATNGIMPNGNASVVKFDMEAITGPQIIIRKKETNRR